MPQLPAKRCETCKFFEPGATPETGSCTHVAIAQDKDRVSVHPEMLSCAGQYFGKPYLWEPKKKSFWPFGRK